MDSKKCLICNGKTKSLHSLYDDRYGYPGTFRYLECIKCCHIFLETPIPDDKLSDLYEQYYPRKEIKVENFKPREERKPIDLWLSGLLASAYRWVPKNCKVLDVGCGMGESVTYHRARECQAYGIDLDENILKIKEVYGLNLKHGLFNNASYPNERFDYITLDQVLEHSSDPISLMKNIKYSLSDTGKCVIAFPNAFGLSRMLLKKKWLNWHCPYHVNFYSKESFRIICQKSGFKVLKRMHITNTLWYYYQILHCLYYPEEGKKSGFWAKDCYNVALEVLQKVVDEPLGSPL